MAFQVVRKWLDKSRNVKSTEIGKPTNNFSFAQRSAAYLNQEETQDDVWYEVEEK